LKTFENLLINQQETL